MAAAVRKAVASTLRADSRVHAKQDTPAMDGHARVSRLDVTDRRRQQFFIF